MYLLIAKKGFLATLRKSFRFAEPPVEQKSSNSRGGTLRGSKRGTVRKSVRDLDDEFAKMEAQISALVDDL